MRRIATIPPAIALAIALAVTAAAPADSITQTVGFFDETMGGSVLIPYDQFDPALGPLR
jgi:hypothetical protein